MDLDGEIIAGKFHQQDFVCVIKLFLNRTNSSMSLLNAIENTFTLELVSNASMDIYRDNTLSSFTNFLPDQIDLDGTWEVALMEISYPARYMNIVDGRVVYKQELKSEDGRVHERWFEIGPEPGFHNSIDSIVTAMNKNLETASNSQISLSEKASLDTLLSLRRGGDQDVKFSDPCPIIVEIEKHSEKTVIEVNNNSIKKDDNFESLDIAGEDLAAIFGFLGPVKAYKMMEYIPSITRTFSILPADIQRIHTIMVYTDIIEHGVIGDTKAPILRCFPFTNRYKKNGELEIPHLMNYKTFGYPLQFHRLLKT